MLNREDTTPAPTAESTVREPSNINIDPDFYIPATRDRGNSYLRAVRILFPRAS